MTKPIRPEVARPDLRPFQEFFAAREDAVAERIATAQRQGRSCHELWQQLDELRAMRYATPFYGVAELADADRLAVVADAYGAAIGPRLTRIRAPQLKLLNRVLAGAALAAVRSGERTPELFKALRCLRGEIESWLEYDEQRKSA